LINIDFYAGKFKKIKQKSTFCNNNNNNGKDLLLKLKNVGSKAFWNDY